MMIKWKRVFKVWGVLVVLAALVNEVSVRLQLAGPTDGAVTGTDIVTADTAANTATNSSIMSSGNESPLVTTRAKEENGSTTATTSTTISSATDLPQAGPPFRLCRVSPTPQLGQPPVNGSLGFKVPLPIWYQCAGPAYDDFMHMVFGYVHRRFQQNHQSRWGRRKYMVPPDYEAHRQVTSSNATIAKQPITPRRILILGNSHTRQVTAALLCHYKTELKGSQQLLKLSAKKNVANLYKFPPPHNLHLYVIVNHPFVYSKKWKTVLERDILHLKQNTTLDDHLDAIVLGTLNEYKDSRKSSFLPTTLQYQTDFPQHGVDFANIPPPHLRDMAQAYRGPIVWLSMFAKYNVGRHKQAVQYIQELSSISNTTTANATTTTRRTNLRSVHGRRYIHSDWGGRECSSNVGERVATCITDRKNVVYGNGHRCCGDKGGQPDIIAWDVVEALWDVLKS